MGTRRIDLREEGFIPKGGVPSWKEQRQMFVELDKNMVRGYMPHSKRIGIVKKDRCVDYSGLQSEEVSGFRSLVEKVGGIGALKGYDKRKSGGMIHLSEGANFSHREIQQPGYKVFFRNARGKELFDKLTKINLGLVARVAGRNLDLGDLDELFQAVSPTLSKAVEEFDYTRGTVFSTCAYTFLNNKFLDIRERGARGNWTADI